MNLVIPLVYQELKKLARARLHQELRAPFETTALVHEAFLKMAGGRHPSYESRAHFFGIASRLMRQILVDAARARAAQKRGAAREITVAEPPDLLPPSDRSLLALNDAMHSLEQIDPQKSRLVEMRYFAGMTAEESAIALSIPVHWVRRDLRLAEAWLRREIANTADVSKLCLGEGHNRQPRGTGYDGPTRFQMNHTPFQAYPARQEVG
jgi:RNA polymerase sigma factor (TIGR02999 family)